jgi:hypothetical protein
VVRELKPKLAAVVVLVAATTAVSGAAALDRPGTIQISNVESKHTHVDLGRAGRSVGDFDVYKFLLYNRRITPRPIGRGEMSCTATGLTTQNCSATYVLPKGEIVVEGAIGSRLIYALAIVGGTGLYNNVRGTLTVTSLRRNPTRELLVFRLVV